jgi:phosphohistidine phosphatase
MKTLLVMRHAKSDWSSSTCDDHDRPLNSRGVKAARLMGRYLTEVDVAPDLIVSSTAVRALTTAELASEAGAWHCPIVTRRELYASEPERVLEVLSSVDPDIERLLIAGHEPTWSALAGRLIGGGRIRMPTAAVACLDFPKSSWADLSTTVCELRWLMTPKMLRTSQDL